MRAHMTGEQHGRPSDTARDQAIDPASHGTNEAADRACRDRNACSMQTGRIIGPVLPTIDQPALA
jgi:hypothetical protein